MSEELKNEEQKEQQKTQETLNAQAETDTEKEAGQDTEKELTVEEKLEAANLKVCRSAPRTFPVKSKI